MSLNTGNLPYAGKRLKNAGPWFWSDQLRRSPFARKRGKACYDQLGHLEWCRAQRSLCNTRKMKRKEKARESEFQRECAREMRTFGSSRFGLGYAPKWSEILYPRSFRTKRSQVSFVPSGIVVSDLSSFGLVPGRNLLCSALDFESKSRRYQNDLWWFGVTSVYSESYPVRFFEGITTTYDRYSKGVCLNCGDHRETGLFCCLRYIRRQLDFLSDAAMDLHQIARIDKGWFRLRFKMVYDEAYRYHLARHRIYWSFVFLGLPYISRFNRVFGMSQDVLRLGSALSGKPVKRKKVTRSTVVEKLAEVTMPSPFEITEQLFKIRHHSRKWFGISWPIIDDRFREALATFKNLMDIGDTEDAFVEYMRARIGEDKLSRLTDEYFGHSVDDSIRSQFHTCRDCKEFNAPYKPKGLWDYDTRWDWPCDWKFIEVAANYGVFISVKGMQIPNPLAGVYGQPNYFNAQYREADYINDCGRAFLVLVGFGRYGLDKKFRVSGTRGNTVLRWTPSSG